ncbi:MAG: M20/M25/M40 family metallo-hydrolase [Oscillospiraceae bacterium]|nr:M20/M25/M40 family metallo-hydrolase [Oscillospiraceae bacterium]
MADLKLINKLFHAPSIGGREAKIRGIITEIIRPYVDDIKVDNMGNLIAFKKGSSPNAKKLMFGAHMDEIGFMVIFIEDNGYLRVTPVGGINWYATSYTLALFENGIRGVIAIDAKTNVADYKPSVAYIDIGAKNKKDAEKKVKIGDFAILDPSLTRLGNRRYAGHPMDDRIGCAVMLEACMKMKDCVNDTYFVFTAQEEVGIRGAKPATHAIMPDYSVAFDVTRTGDTIGAAPMAVKLGDGAAIKIKDSSVICDVIMVEKLKNLAKENKIKYQLEILETGGTDATAMQMEGSGSIAGAVSIPTRYIHTCYETIDLGDYDACVDLAVKVLEYEFN